MKRNKIESAPEKNKEPEPQDISRGYEWIIRDTGRRYVFAEMQFPNGTIVDYSQFEGMAYSRLIKGTVMDEIPTAEGLIELIGCPEHSYNSPIFLELLRKHYPDKFQDGLKALETKVKSQLTELFLFYNAIDEKNPEKISRRFHCDEKLYWYDQLDLSQKELDDLREHHQADAKKEDFLSPQVIDASTGVFLRYAPPIGTKKDGYGNEKKKWEIKDYLRTPKLQKKYKQNIPHIGKSWKEVKEWVTKDPLSALRFALSNLPTYNAGANAFIFEDTIKKLKNRISKEEVLKIISKNKTLGPFDIDPFTRVIKNIYGC